MENTLHLNTYHQGDSYPQPCTSEPAQTPIQPGQSATTGWYVIHCQPCKKPYIPQPILEQVVQSIYHEVKRLNDRGDRSATTFHPDATVTLKSGPLQGLEAIKVSFKQPRKSCALHVVPTKEHLSVSTSAANIYSHNHNKI